MNYNNDEMIYRPPDFLIIKDFFIIIIISRQVYLLPQVCVVLQFVFAASFYF